MTERYYIEDDAGMNTPGTWRVVPESEWRKRFHAGSSARPMYIALAFNQEMAERIARLLNEENKASAT